MAFTETSKESKLMYNGRIVRVRSDVVELSDGKPATREVVEHPGGVCIAALDDQHNVCIVQQFRYPMGETVLELPAGKLEYGEDPDAAAVRELQEETGVTAKDVQRVGVIYPSPGYCTEKLYLYLATGLTDGPQNLDDGELLSADKMPLQQALELVMNNTIKDGKTVALLLLVDRLIHRSEDSL